MTPDSELLDRYARLGSQDAFAELVNRHLNLVYSAALRQVNGDAHLAQDVAQTVFADLARKAAPLSRRTTITGWLYTSAYFAAAKIARTENRRRDREEKFMREPIHESAPETDWKQIRPTLDKAMHELKEADREAILLRYFENRQFAEVGEKLGLNENAARMRVERALEKLRNILAQGGISTTAALSTVISTSAVQLAPAGLAVTLTTTSLAVAGTGTTLTALKLMAMTKLKLAASVIVLASVGVGIYKAQQASTLQKQIQSLQQQQTHIADTTIQIDALLAENQQLKSEQNSAELLSLRGEVTQLQAKMQGLSQASKVQLESQNRFSRLLTLLSPMASRVVTNKIARTTVFYPETLRDVGTQTLDDAVQTTLFVLSTHDSEVLKKIPTPTNATPRSIATNFDRMAAEFQGVSEINFTLQSDNLDGSADVSCRLIYNEGVNTNYDRVQLIMHLQPVEQRWGVDISRLSIPKSVRVGTSFEY